MPQQSGLHLYREAPISAMVMNTIIDLDTDIHRYGYPYWRPFCNMYMGLLALRDQSINKSYKHPKKHNYHSPQVNQLTIYRLRSEYCTLTSVYCLGRKLDNLSPLRKVQKLWGWLNRGEKWQYTAQCAAKQCSTHLQSFFLYYLVFVELLYFF